MHISLRVDPRVGNLRRALVYAAIRAATIAAARHDGCRIVHASIQRTHLHLIVEADSAAALTRTMRSFTISGAMLINRVLGTSGPVFERYRASALASPRQVRNCIAYVLNNWRRHDEDQRPAAARWLVDKYSSAVAFAGWKELGHGEQFAIPSHYAPLTVWEPRRWLLREGWRKHGLIRADEVPSGVAHPSPVTQ